MAITRHIANLILSEHKFKPIQNNVLLLGRQTVFMTPDQAIKLVESFGIEIKSGIKINFGSTADAPKNTFIEDKSFFSLFSEANVLACDISDYEGADIIFDLSDNPPPDLINHFNFIYNGSVLDNLSDPFNAINNVSKMLTDDGVAFHEEGMNHDSPAYFKFCPDWFFDYAAINKFTDCQTFVCTHDDVHLSPWVVLEAHPYYFDTENNIRLTKAIKLTNHAAVISIMNKGPFSTTNLKPIQKEYRKNHTDYLTFFQLIYNSERRRALQGSNFVSSVNSGYNFLKEVF